MSEEIVTIDVYEGSEDVVINVYEGTVQTDWNETNTDAASYLKNKPTFDDTVTETSDNPVRGSGIWAWVTGLFTAFSDTLKTIATSGVHNDATERDAADAHPATAITVDETPVADYTQAEQGDNLQQVTNKVAGLQAVQDLKINTLGNISGNVNIDLTLGSYVTATLTDAIVLAFTGLPSSGLVREFILAFSNIHAITYPVGTKFTGGIAPTIIASPYEIYCMIDSSGSLTVNGLVDDINTPV